MTKLESEVIRTIIIAKPYCPIGSPFFNVPNSLKIKVEFVNKDYGPKPILEAIYMNWSLIFMGILVFTQPLWPSDFGTSHHDGHFNRPETGATATPLEKIQGHCMIIPGNGNLMAQPCGNLVITLNYPGGPTLYTRATGTGIFEFQVPPDKKFKIAVDSKYYEVVTPKGSIERGDDIELQLRQK
jgi:hypothetical protein